MPGCGECTPSRGLPRRQSRPPVSHWRTLRFLCGPGLRFRTRPSAALLQLRTARPRTIVVSLNTGTREVEPPAVCGVWWKQRSVPAPRLALPFGRKKRVGFRAGLRELHVKIDGHLTSRTHRSQRTSCSFSLPPLRPSSPRFVRTLPSTNRALKADSVC